MAVFKLFKQTGNRALYRTEGSQNSVRFSSKAFKGSLPESIEIGGEGIEFVTGGASTSTKANMPDDVREAAEKLAAYRKQQQEARLASMTPEQREKREARERQRQEAREAKRAARKAAKAPNAGPVAAAAAAPKGGKLPGARK